MKLNSCTVAVDVSELIESPSKDTLFEYIDGGLNKHKWHQETVSRAEIMSMFYNAIDVDTSDKSALKRILPQSVTESDADYDHRIERTPVIPFEKKFVRAKERIFQGHGVSRNFSESDMDNFWEEKFGHFDDQGSTIDKFFREKVFHYKEVFGFGGIVIDLLTKIVTQEDGSRLYQTFTDENGEPLPYAYLVRPDEIYQFEMDQGYIKFVIIRQNISHKKNDVDYKYTAITPERIFVWEQSYRNEPDDEEPKTDTVEVLDTEHDFGKVPFVFIKGEEDIDSAYQIGRPERYSLVPMYRTALEIYYDLQEVSLLYAHPIPIMSEETVKQLVGAIDDDGKYNPEVISAQIGAVAQIPDNAEFPDQLFFQPDMQGLNHLKDYLLDIIDSVHKFASIRDKTQIVANTSGVSKALDTVEERGVLATASRDMEEVERDTLEIMASVRSDVDFDRKDIKYQKEFDLSTASEHFSTMIEGMTKGALTHEMYKYHALEGLRKSGAPQSKIDKVESDLEEFGKPLKATISDVIDLVENMDENKEQIVDALGKEIKILKNFVNKRKQSESDGNEEQPEGDEFDEDDSE